MQPIEHYNQTRLHSAIGYVAPADKLHGRAPAIHAARDQKLAEARERRRQQRQADREQATKPDRSDEREERLARRPIDYAALRALVSMAAVLPLIGFRPNQAGAVKQRGPCPLHGSTRDISRCFSVDVQRQVFQCFKCGKAGNALELWVAATKLPLYDAAVDLCARLNLDVPYLPCEAPGHREEEPVGSSPRQASSTR